jgi:hypothetical protein
MIGECAYIESGGSTTKLYCYGPFGVMVMVINSGPWQNVPTQRATFKITYMATFYLGEPIAEPHVTVAVRDGGPNIRGSCSGVQKGVILGLPQSS